jgi:hypothetical protein
MYGSSGWGRSASSWYLPGRGYFERSGGAERTSQPLSTSGDTSSLMEYPSTIIRLWLKRNDKLHAANKAEFPCTTQCSALRNGANETYLHAIEKPHRGLKWVGNDTIVQRLSFSCRRAVLANHEHANSDDLQFCGRTTKTLDLSRHKRISPKLVHVID